MIVSNEIDPKSTMISISFELLTFKLVAKLKVNPKNMTLKGLRPVLAERFGIDFSHMRTRFSAKTDKK